MVVVGVALAVAYVAGKRRPDPPSAPSYRAPTQIDRDDFDDPEAHILIAVFASNSCDACAQAWDMVQTVKLDGVATQRILVEDNPGLHKRYKVDGVPTTIIAGPDGVVRRSFLGPITADQVASLSN